MKKELTILFLVLSQLVIAQDSYDALLYAQQDIMGTARYVGMSGAFAALGGDPSAVRDNPASLGVFRKSDIAISLDLNFNKTLTNWSTMVKNDSYIANTFKLSCGQFNYVQNFPTLNVETGLITHSLMFGYNRLKNYNREITARSTNKTISFTDYLANFSNGITESQMGDNAFNDVNVPWLTILGYETYLINPDTINPGQWSSALEPDEKVNSSYDAIESGWMDEYNLGWGANISNRLYFGISMAIRAMRYNKNITYQESFENGGYLSLNTLYTVSGVGFNATAGIIYRPTDNIRFGLSAQIPTFMNYKEYYDAQMISNGMVQSTEVTVTTPKSDVIRYRLTNPWRLTAGTAVTFSSRGLISFEYDYEGYHTMRYSNNTGNVSAWRVENDLIRNNLRDLHTFRVGTEWFLTSVFAIRAGYAFKSSFNTEVPERYIASNAMRTDTEYGIVARQHYIGVGLGFRNHLVIADIAYQYRISNELVKPYPDVNAIDLSATSHRIVFTFGIK